AGRCAAKSIRSTRRQRASSTVCGCVAACGVVSAPGTSMKTIWILVADSSRARIFEAQGATGDVREIETFNHPKGRAHNRDLKTDGSGRYFGKGEQNQGHTAAPQVEPAEHEAELFAKQMTDHLEKARVDHR